MKVSAKEIEAMSNKGSKERYIYSIKRIVDNEKAWVLDYDGFALSGINGDNSEVLILWPAREYAANCAIDGWKNYKPKALSLDYIMDELLPKLSSKGTQVGIFSVPGLSNTPVVDAESLLLDLEHECSNYM
ncbi:MULTISPECIES: DUF2750 domain-containing protein [unclassified Gilliamella]|uniref:DUF2750 domain-containing protein n=1 Tax=unclassified Gilliamella TaxID=2685620 RepID=UPI00080DBDB3|nr:MULTISPECIES: DUF2750 domain-containing protein [Gilliamella]MCO6538477.1 DUF2750 domain-containing protein [Gilliamella sp.]OCG77482.1 hypothetical protein A9G44_04930 [Gilliamella apicola]